MNPPYPQGTQSVPGVLAPGTAPMGPPGVRPRPHLGPPGGIVHAPVPQRPNEGRPQRPLGPPRPMGPPRPVMGALGPPRPPQTTAIAGGPRPMPPQNGIEPRPMAAARPVLNGPPQRPALSQNGLHAGTSGPNGAPFRPPSAAASQNSLPSAQVAAGPQFPGNAAQPRAPIGGLPGVVHPSVRPPLMAAAGTGPRPQPLTATGSLVPSSNISRPQFPATSRAPPLTNGSQGPPPSNGFPPPPSSSSSVRPMYPAMPPAAPLSHNGPQQSQHPGMVPPPPPTSMPNGPAMPQLSQPPLPPPPTVSQQNGMESAPAQPHPPLPPTSAAPKSHYPPMPQSQPQPQRPLPPQPPGDGSYGNRFQSAFSSTVRWFCYYDTCDILALVRRR